MEEFSPLFVVKCTLCLLHMRHSTPLLHLGSLWCTPCPRACSIIESFPLFIYYVELILCFFSYYVITGSIFIYFLKCHAHHYLRAIENRLYGICSTEPWNVNKAHKIAVLVLKPTYNYLTEKFKVSRTIRAKTAYPVPFFPLSAVLY